jgi:hypothetical protein
MATIHCSNPPEHVPLSVRPISHSSVPAAGGLVADGQIGVAAQLAVVHITPTPCDAVSHVHGEMSLHAQRAGQASSDPLQVLNPLKISQLLSAWHVPVTAELHWRVTVSNGAYGHTFPQLAATRATNRVPMTMKRNDEHNMMALALHTANKRRVANT